MDNFDFKCRAIDNETKKFVYGYYVYNEYVKKHLIITPASFDNSGSIIGEKIHVVNPLTLGRCTGMKDTNKNMIYEGDFVVSSANVKAGIHVVKFGMLKMLEYEDENTVYVKCWKAGDDEPLTAEYVITGNVHEAYASNSIL